MSAEQNLLGVLTTSYPTSAHSSAGTFVRGFCVACARAGHLVEVLCPESAVTPEPPDDAGVRVRPLAYARPRHLQFLSAAPGAPEELTDRPVLWAPAAAYAARLTAEVMGRQRRYGAVVSHWLLPCAVSGALATRRPHLAIAHGSDVHLLERLPVGRAVARWLVKQGVRLAFVSTDLRRRFAAMLTSPLADQMHAGAVVQPMGVHAAELTGGDRRGARARLALTGPVALWLGRLTPLKRPALALALAEAMPELTVVLAGAGPAESALRQRAQGLGARVRLCGWANSAQRRDLLAAADLLVITSTVLPGGRSEGAPVVAREGLAAGLPVVATRVGGLEDLTALNAPLRLVDDGDVAALAAASRGLLAAGKPDVVRSAHLARELDWQTVLPRLLAPLGLQFSPSAVSHK